MKRVLIVIDMQEDFVRGSLGSKDAEAIVSKVKAKITEYMERGDKIIFTRAERRLCNCAEVIWRKQSRNFVQACQQECPSSADYQTWYGASDACNRSGYYRDDLLMAGYRTLFCKCSTGNGLSDRYEYSCAFRNPCYSRKSVIGYFILCDRSSN